MLIHKMCALPLICFSLFISMNTVIVMSLLNVNSISQRNSMTGVNISPAINMHLLRHLPAPSKEGVHGSPPSHSARLYHHDRKKFHPEPYHKQHRHSYSKKGLAFAPSQAPIPSSKRLLRGPLPLPAMPFNYYMDLALLPLFPREVLR